MPDNVMYIVWAAAIVGFGILEGITVQLVSIWFLAGAVAGLISAFCGAPIYLQVIIWLAVSVVSLLATRPLVKKKINTQMQPTNSDRNIGRDATVIETIDNLKAKGQVKVDGQIWTARSENDQIIPQGTIVVVKRIDGVKLIVETK